MNSYPPQWPPDPSTPGAGGAAGRSQPGYPSYPPYPGAGYPAYPSPSGYAGYPPPAGQPPTWQSPYDTGATIPMERRPPAMPAARAPHPQSAKQAPRMPRAQALALAGKLKKQIAVFSVVSFGVLAGLVALHPVGSAAQAQSSQTTQPSGTQNIPAIAPDQQQPDQQQQNSQGGGFFSSSGGGYNVGPQQQNQLPVTGSGVS